jgi:transcriptional regulator with XRE-family HTH domain
MRIIAIQYKVAVRQRGVACQVGGEDAMNGEFQEWLKREMLSRDWNQSELARRSDISHGRISQVMRGENPGVKFCGGVALAFQLPAMSVLEKAGLVRPGRVRTADESHVGQLFSMLDDDDQERVVVMLRALVEHRNRGEDMPSERAGDRPHLQTRLF